MSKRVRLTVEIEKWPLKAPVRITGYTFVELELVVVSLNGGGYMGRGEAAGVYYRNENATSVTRQIESVRAAVEEGLTREKLQDILPIGGARNALDCAAWDLEAKMSGRPVWQLAGLSPPKALLTTYTLGADEPGKMAAGARAFAGARALKLKLTGEAEDAERVRAVRAARPDVWLGVDANQGFTPEGLGRVLPALIECDVKLIEQPFRIGHESQMEGLGLPIPTAADESAQGVRDLPALVGRFDMVNIKLDKCGGLTEALAMGREARRLGLDVMVGNMGGTSWAMAPAFLVGQICQVVDLDGPLIFNSDRPTAVRYQNGELTCGDEVWGGATSGSSRVQ
jgi:L-alanine-DL-glutamate epimerase-like enolase superfamily enzyme